MSGHFFPDCGRDASKMERMWSLSSDPPPPWHFGRVAGTGWEGVPALWSVPRSVGPVTLLWPEGCHCFKAFQDKQLDCSFQTFRYVKQLLLWGLELELCEGEEGDVLEIKNLFPAL